MLTIYGNYRSRAVRVLWLAAELDIPFRLVPVIQVRRVKDPSAPDAPLHSRSAEYLKINPNGRIPTIDDDGLVLFESLAINLYLARKHGGPVGPSSREEDGQMTMWAVWAACEVEKFAPQILMNRLVLPVAQRDPKLVDACIEALRAPFAVLEKILGKSDYLVGNRFTVADLNVSDIVRYADSAPELLEAAPNIRRWFVACRDRPAYKAVMAKREAEPE